MKWCPIVFYNIPITLIVLMEMITVWMHWQTIFAGKFNAVIDFIYLFFAVYNIGIFLFMISALMVIKHGITAKKIMGKHPGTINPALIDFHA